MPSVNAGRKSLPFAVGHVNRCSWSCRERSQDSLLLADFGVLLYAMKTTLRRFLDAFLLSLVIMYALAGAAQTGAAETSARSATNPPTRITEYSLPADKLEKAHALYIVEGWIYLISTVYGFGIMFFFVHLRWAAKFRDCAERVSRSRLVQAFIVIPLFTSSLWTLLLPPLLYGHHIGLRFGLSVQGWGSWFRDRGVELLITCVVGVFVGWILYFVIHKSPRLWWLYFWFAVIPISAFVVFITPAVIDPMFNKFEPLDSTQPQLVSALEAVVQRAGLTIPRSRMFVMKASAKVTGSNAYVTGFGSTKRVVVWDTAITKLSVPELQVVFGHEIGHYVLDHVVEGFIFAMLVALGLFYCCYRVATWALRTQGGRWQLRGLDDWASMPLLLLIASVLMFVSSPITNGFSRYLEHQADTYGLEVTHGLVPDSSQVAAQSFQHLGEEWLDYPFASRLTIFWLWDHPATPDRVRYALEYDPWATGQAPEFVKDSLPQR